MDPMTGAATVGVAGGLAQAYQSEKARQANQERLDEIKAMFEKIVPPEYNMSIETPPEVIDRTIPPAAYDFTKITPKEFAVVGKYSPQTAALIAEKKPTLLQETATTKAGKDAQMQALQILRQRATGPNLEMEAGINKANQQAQIQAQSRQKSILQDAARRGQLGSGAMLAAQMQGGSDSMNRAAMESQDAAVDADKQALQYLMSSANLGRQVSQDDLSEQRTNADIINAFNQRATKEAQDWENQRNSEQNRAQVMNLQNQQDISNKNTQLGNETDWRNREMYNQGVGQQRQEQVGERNYQNQRYQQRADQQKYLNQLKSQQYADQMNRASGMSGTFQQMNNANTQATADRNKAIQGISDIGMAYGSYAGNKEEREKDRKARYGNYDQDEEE